MKILKILGIAAGVHALALILIFSNPGCSYSKASGPESPPITSAPTTDAATPPAAAGTDTATIRYSPTRPNTAVASALEAEPVSGVTPVSTYTVTRGDNLWSIAKANQITRTELATANKLGPNATLHVGQKLIIPSKTRPAETAPAAVPASNGAAVPGASTPAAGADKPAEMQKHVVRMGETLGGIARKYGVRQGDIAVANNITDPKKIQPGQELLIPARSAAKGAKGPRAKADTAAGEAKPAPAAPETDLDAGLKPANPSDVPVVKIEDNPPAQPQKNP